jgi:hypothetical protein
LTMSHEADGWATGGGAHRWADSVNGFTIDDPCSYLLTGTARS